MTHPTDDELDALVQELMNRPYRRGSESNDEAAMRRQGEREQAAAAITAMRAQLAEVRAELHGPIKRLSAQDYSNVIAHLSPELEPNGELPNRNSLMMALVESTNAARKDAARADRAEQRVATLEAALAAQIEAADALGYTCTGCGHLCGDPDKDMKTLQRAGSISCCPERKMVPLSQAITHDRTALDRTLREAILEGMRIATFTPIEQVPSSVDAAILALLNQPKETK